MANLRVTQVVREVAVEPVGTNAEVAHFYIDVAVMPNSDVAVTSQAVEVLRSLPNAIAINRTLSLTGTLLTATAAGAASAWLQKRKKKLIFFVTMHIRNVVDSGFGAVVYTADLHLANHALNTKATDTPANTEFIAILSDQNIPPLKQELADAIYGVTLPSFGKIVINNQDGQFDDYLAWSWEGGTFTLKLTGDKSELDFSNALTVFTGVMGKMTYSDNVISVEILSRSQELSTKTLPTDTFLGPDGQDVPSPICYGYVNNITPILKDNVNYVYKIAGHALASNDAVYDNGVALAAGQWTSDLANGEFTLNQVPSGVITCNAAGKIIDGAFSARRGDFIKDMAKTYAALTDADLEGASFQQFNVDVPENSGMWISSQVSIIDAMNELLRPVLGFVFFSRAGLMTIGQFKLPAGDASAVIELNSSNIFPQGDAQSDASAAGDILLVEQVNQLYASVTLKYKLNYTVQKESELGAADPVDPTTAAGAARRAYLSKDGFEAKVSLTGSTEGRNLYPTAIDMDPIQSYYFDKVHAQTAAQYFLTVFGIKRWIVVVKTNLLSSQTLLHNIVQLTYTVEDEATGGIKARFFNGKKARIIGYEENYGDNTTTIKLFV